MLFGVLFAEIGVASECAWYLVNFTIAVACGIFFLHFVMKGYSHFVERYDLRLLRSGEYGEPPSWKPWFLQMLIWGIIASLEKLITAAAILWPLRHALDGFAAWIESPLQGYPNAELAVVMILAPVLLNALFYWIVDNIIKRREKEDIREICLDEEDYAEAGGESGTVFVGGATGYYQ